MSDLERTQLDTPWAQANDYAHHRHGFTVLRQSSSKIIDKALSYGKQPFVRKRELFLNSIEVRSRGVGKVKKGSWEVLDC